MFREQSVNPQGTHSLKIKWQPGIYIVLNVARLKPEPSKTTAFLIIIITKTGTAQWERARLYRINRLPLDHVRQKKRK